MSASERWPERGGAPDTLDGRLHARAVAEQMKAATSSLRARLSLVRGTEEGARRARPGS